MNKVIWKDVKDTPLHMIFHEWYRERIEEWKREAITDLQIDANELLAFTNDDFTIKTLRDFVRYFQKNQNAEIFLEYLTQMWDYKDQHGRGHNQLSVLLEIFFEWEGGKKYFSEMNLRVDIKAWNFFLNRVRTGIIEKDGFDEEVYLAIKERLDKIFKSIS